MFVYSAVVVFVHPGQVLTTIQNAVGFFQQQYDAILQGSHSNGWCTLCKLPNYETSQYFLVVPRMLYSALPMSEPSADPTVQAQLCLDTASCDADCMIIWLLHHMCHHDTDYAMITCPWHCDVTWMCLRISAWRSIQSCGRIPSTPLGRQAALERRLTWP